MSLLTNAVFVSVIVMTILCVLRLNVLLSIIIAALVAGYLSPLPLSGSVHDSVWQHFIQQTIATSEILIKGMSSNLGIALSYILLGGIAVAISRTHLMNFLLAGIAKAISSKKFIFILSLALIACCSQNLVPIHIAFIPILIPPLLALMNRLKIDRRAVACALAFGLQAPYVTLGVGFGLIFHNTISQQISANGLSVSLGDVGSVMWIGGLAMFLGLLFAVFVLYRKPREYIQHEEQMVGEATMGRREYATLFGIAVLFVVQLITESLALGAFAGLICMIIFGGIKWNEVDSVMEGGMKMMAFIAFVMLIAAGYGEVLRQGGGVESLVNSVFSIISHQEPTSNALAGSLSADSIQATLAQGHSVGIWVKLIGASLMLLVGLLITIGIGTSFGTIPIVAAIYVPFGLSLGFSGFAIILLVGIAGALGDAGSPASDSTLGPTSGLNADGQHNHIYDTCIPTFFVYNIPLLISGIVGAMIL